jgi:hypothetical protein
MEIVVSIQGQAWCNVFGGTLQGSILAIGTKIDRSAAHTAIQNQ